MGTTHKTTEIYTYITKADKVWRKKNPYSLWVLFCFRLLCMVLMSFVAILCYYQTEHRFLDDILFLCVTLSVKADKVWRKQHPH